MERRALRHDQGTKHIVNIAVNLSHRLNMKVVAEGVQDQASHAYLHNIGCDMAQGYYIGRPVQADTLIADYQTAGGAVQLD